MTIQLVSAVICPFVQRAVILLREKGVEHETAYIDLDDKPDWFLKMSPRGKVPLLLVDEVPLFESQAICEFLEETNPEPPLMPAEPVARALDRAWFAFAGEELFMRLHKLMTGSEQEAWDETAAQLRTALERVEEALEGRDWLSGDGTRFGMADVAAAPFFTRAAFLAELEAWDLPEDLLNLRGWGARLLVRPAVADSVPDGFEDAMLAYMRKNEALVLAD